MFGPWMQIKVKAIGAASVQRLEDHLMQSTPAMVEQSFKDGKYFHELDSDGTYTVRVMDASPMSVVIVKGIIKHNGFDVVSEIPHDD